MKNVVIILSAFVLIALNGNAQSEAFTKKMQQTIALMDSAKTTEQLTGVYAQFERIANAEKTQWLPYYYAALTQLSISYMDNNVDKDKMASVALPLIEKAETIEKNAELYCLRNMVANQQMGVDPMNRWQKYGAEAGTALTKAKALDATNPRIYYLEAMSVFYTPENFGGGKAKAKPVFEKAVALFKTFKPASALHPTWGQKTTEEMLAKCN